MDTGHTKQWWTLIQSLLQEIPLYGVKPTFNLNLLFSCHTLNIQDCGFMNDDLPNLSLFSLNGPNLILKASRCFLSWLGTLLEPWRRDWSTCSWDVEISSTRMENIVNRHTDSVNRFETSHSPNQNHNLSWMLWLDPTGLDVCPWLHVGEVDSTMEWLSWWTIPLASKSSFCQNCYPQEKGNHFEYDGCSAHYHSVASLSGFIQNLDKKTSDTNCLLCTLAYPRLINASIFPGPVYVSTLRLEKSHAFKIPLCGVVSDLTKFFNTLQRKYLK